LEIVLDSAASIEPKLQVREYSVNYVLVGSPEKGSNFRGIFGLLDSCVFIGIFGISVVGMSPFILPTNVVGVAVVI
jgi:hypothetical protein